MKTVIIIILACILLVLVAIFFCLYKIFTKLYKEEIEQKVKWREEAKKEKEEQQQKVREIKRWRIINDEELTKKLKSKKEAQEIEYYESRRLIYSKNKKSIKLPIFIPGFDLDIMEVEND
jgi:flagellar biosynthesis/type III secretory pathway M-ring protein FliF/YscJ